MPTYLTHLDGCIESTSCTCSECRRHYNMVSAIKEHPEWESEVGETLEAYLVAYEMDYPHQKTLKLQLEGYLDRKSRETERLKAPTKRVFYFKPATPRYWSLMPHHGGYQVAEVTPDGYTDSFWFELYSQALEHLHGLGAMPTSEDDMTPVLTVTSPRFKAMNVICDAKRQFQANQMSQKAFDHVISTVKRRLEELDPNTVLA